MRNIISLPILIMLIVSLFISSVAWRVEYLDGQMILINKILKNDFVERCLYEQDPNESAGFYYYYYDIIGYIG